MGGRKIKDKTGNRYGKLVVVEYAGKLTSKGRMRHCWKCLCDCGNETILRTSELREKAHTKSCGCSKIPDRKGERYGNLVAIEYFGRNKNGFSVWMFQCDCGNTIVSGWDHIRNRTNISCGCIRKYTRSKGWRSKGWRSKMSSEEAGLRILYSRYKSTAIRLNREFSLTMEQFEKLTSDKCYYCGTLPGRLIKGYISNGIDRANNSLGYSIENSRPCCWSCNQLKGSRNENEFLEYIAIILRHTTSTEAGLCL